MSAPQAPANPSVDPSQIEWVELTLRCDTTLTVGADTIARFWAKVDKNGPTMPHMDTPCWIWKAALRGSRGYGVFGITKKHLVGSHSFSYWLHNGVYVRGLDHRCHNRACPNPDHLRPLSNKQNLENRAGLNSNNKSGVRGVFWSERDNRWLARVTHNGKTYGAGYHRTMEAAEAAVIAKRNELFSCNDLDRVSADV